MASKKKIIEFIVVKTILDSLVDIPIPFIREKHFFEVFRINNLIEKLSFEPIEKNDY